MVRLYLFFKKKFKFMNINKLSFLKQFKNKKVLITGHTGFKGSWLSYWLVLLGAKVIGLSINIPSKPSHFDSIKLQKRIIHKKIENSSYF